MQH
ncbi:BgTH12-06754 [Blumeria graminis f. sp. triticale]|jgi:hypothetical protein